MGSAHGMGSRTLHNAAQGVKDGLGGEVLGGDEVDGVLLSLLLLLDDVEDGGVGLPQVGGQHLLTSISISISTSTTSLSSRTSSSSSRFTPYTLLPFEGGGRGRLGAARRSALDADSGPRSRPSRQGAESSTRGGSESGKRHGYLRFTDWSQLGGARDRRGRGREAGTGGRTGTSRRAVGGGGRCWMEMGIGVKVGRLKTYRLRPVDASFHSAADGQDRGRRCELSRERVRALAGLSRANRGR